MGNTISIMRIIPLSLCYGESFDPESVICANLDSLLYKLTHLPEEFSL